MTQTTWGLIVAGGKSERMGEVDISFLYLNDRPVVTYSMQAFEHCPEIERVVVAVDKHRADSVTGIAQLFGCVKVKKVVVASGPRAAFVTAGLEAMDEDVDFVCVHGASRPLLTTEQVSATIQSAKKNGSGVLALGLSDQVRECKKGMVVSNGFEAGALWLTLSPQTFRRAALVEAYEKAKKNKKQPEDELSAMEQLKDSIRLVPTDRNSPRIQTSHDLALVTALAQV